MPLTIAPDQLRQIEDGQEELLLGIISTEGAVRLRRADRKTVIGHHEWLALEPMSDVKRGFSIGVKKGRIVALYRSSTLNPGPFGEIEDVYFRELLSLLPMANTFRAFV